MLKIDVKKAMTLLEWIGAASEAASWQGEGEWPAVAIRFHCVGTLEEDLSVLEERGSSSVSGTVVLAIATYHLGFASADQGDGDELDMDRHIPMQRHCA